MVKSVETHLFAVGGVFSQFVSIVTGDYVIHTILPSIIGAILHTVNRARKDQLSGFDVLLACVTALAIGIWGGPWIAQLAPASESALPIMCFTSAFYARTFIEWSQNVLENFLIGFKPKNDK